MAAPGGEWSLSYRLWYTCFGWRVYFYFIVTFYGDSQRVFLPRDAMHKRGLCRRAVCVCMFVTFVYSVETSKHAYLQKFFSLSGSHTIVVFPYQALWHDSDRDPLIGAKSLFSTDTRSMTDTASSKVITLSGGVCVSRKRTTKCQNFVYDTKPGRRFYQSTGIGWRRQNRI